jgi:hypothetical protein
MEKYSLLMMTKKFRDRWSFTLNGLKSLPEKRTLMINPYLIVRIIIIKKDNN